MCRGQSLFELLDALSMGGALTAALRRPGGCADWRGVLCGLCGISIADHGLHGGHAGEAGRSVGRSVGR